MKIGLDYDETFTADKCLWERFIKDVQSCGHLIVFVTYRYQPDEGICFNDDIISDGKRLGIDVIFTNGCQKAGIVTDVDIWIDDSPISIPIASDLKTMYEGCDDDDE